MQIHVSRVLNKNMTTKEKSSVKKLSAMVRDPVLRKVLTLKASLIRATSSPDCRWSKKRCGRYMMCR